MSTERIIVVDAVADAFVQKFAAKVRTLAAGDTRDSKPPLGVVVDRKTTDKLAAMVDDAVAKGASVVSAGDAKGVLVPARGRRRHPGDAALRGGELRPRRRGDPRPRRGRRDPHRERLRVRPVGRGLRRQCRPWAEGRAPDQVGHLPRQRPTVHDEAQMPFGGVRASGYGRFGGKARIAEFTELRWITVETEPGHYAI
jgi:hypothetical protein